VLIIDDFLADGQAVHGLMSLCEQQKAKVVGVGIAIEKGFQPGGKQLREAGIHLKPLAVVDGVQDGKIIVRPDDD
jgi:xanthine phosphoribosyltransferase